MNNSLLSLLLCLFMQIGFAEELVDDFTYKIPLTTQQESAAYDFQMPQVVYEKAKDSLLRDARIFNAQGDAVPMRLGLTSDEIKQSVSSVTLPMFNVNHTVSTPLRSKQVSTSWQGDVQQFTVETSESVQNYLRSQEAIQQDRLLLDASVLKQAALDALQLTWQFDTPGNRVFYVEVKGSHDLSNWQTLQAKHKLIELNTGQRVVLENTIPMQGQTFEYYQLRFIGEPVPVVSEVKAIMRSHAYEQPLKQQKVTSFTVLDADVHGHAIEWDSGGYFPIEAIKVNFDYKNLMADVRLYSRATERSNWQSVSNSQFYQVGTGEMSMLKNSLSFRSNNHRYWKLATQSSISSQWIKGLSFEWRPHHLQFLAQGNGPYVLYFSHPKLKQSVSDRWYQQLNSQLRQGMFSDQIQTGKAEKLASKPKPAEPEIDNLASQWLFWGLLVVVLSALFYMASRLMKEVNKAG